MFLTSSRKWELAQQTSEKASQLIEVVRARDIHIPADRDFITFTDIFNVKGHHWHVLSYLRTFADATRGNNNLAR